MSLRQLNTALYHLILGILSYQPARSIIRIRSIERFGLLSARVSGSDPVNRFTGPSL